MSKKFMKRIWLVHPCNEKTKKVLGVNLNLRDFFHEEVEEFDATNQKKNEELELVRLHSYDEVQYLRRNKKAFDINFKIFIQDYPDGKIYRWTHDH
jgi:hypothetical protein